MFYTLLPKKFQPMKKLNALIVLLLLTGSVLAQTTWTVDKAHSKLGFTVTHLLVSEVDGTFNSFDAKITSSKEDFTDAVIELTADVNSIDTNVEMRDNDLKSDNFFDVAKFPTLTFKSTSITKTGEKTYKVKGDLTMHGITKSVELDATLNGVITGRSGKQVSGWKVTGTINRTDFKVGKSGPTVSDDVNIIAKAEFKAN
jgi:polyisoprenoid-binding protein YceI